jgi:hypothetical protein
LPSYIRIGANRAWCQKRPVCETGRQKMPSKQKPTWRPGLHDVYVARDKQTGWFKIGITGKDLEYYRKQLCQKIYGRRSQDKIEISCSWLFEDFWAAWYIEQTAIALVERFEFEKVRLGDWFAIDTPTMSVVVDLIDDLTFPIRKWEQVNFDPGLKCKPPRNEPWGTALRRAGLTQDFARPVFGQLLPSHT